MTGTSILLYSKQKTSEDEFGRPIYTETAETIENVLIGEPTGEEVIDTLLSGSNR